MNKERIKRLEELAKLKKEAPLMGSLLEEYNQLRSEYLISVKTNLKTQLENQGFVKKEKIN